jgi:sialate O-acetylesterase
MPLSIRLLVPLLFLNYFVSAQVRLPSLISDGMVLQRDANLNIWGWAAKGEKLTIRFNDKSYAAIEILPANGILFYPK